MPLSIFNRKSTSCVGVDIHTDEIFLLKINHMGKEKQITTLGSIPLSQNCIQDGKIVNLDLFATTLKKLVQETKTKGNLAAVAIPAQHVMTKRLQLPNFSHHEEYEAEIHTHFDRYVPGMSGEVCFDYHIMEKDTQHSTLQFVATKQDIVDTYRDVINQAGLKLKIIDVDSYAIVRGFRCYINLINKNLVLLDINQRCVRILFLHNENIVFTHRMYWNLNEDPMRDKIVSFVQQAMQMYAGLGMHQLLQCLYITGNLIGLDSIATLLHSILKIKIQIPLISVNANLSYCLPEKSISQFILRSLTSVGLALRECPS